MSTIALSVFLRVFIRSNRACEPFISVLIMKYTRAKALTLKYFTGIAQSFFEYCVIDRFKEFLVAADNQFGFRKGLRLAVQFTVLLVLLIIY